MEFWFSELHTGNVKLSIKIEKQLFSGESEYQRIDVFDSEEFGKFISLDGEIVFSEKDEFIYDEMVNIGRLEAEAVAQKQLMVEPNMPRFVL